MDELKEWLIRQQRNCDRQLSLLNIHEYHSKIEIERLKVESLAYQAVLNKIKESEDKMKLQSCKQCRFKSSDSCNEAVWYFCAHPRTLDIWGIDGRLLEDTSVIPEWCPLIVFCATCGKETNGSEFCSQECSEYETLE